jgi:hypothetical protein
MLRESQQILLESAEGYRAEEVESILRRALRRKRDSGEITSCELAETARDLGISKTELRRAIAEERRFGEFEAAKEQWITGRKRKLYSHLRAYLIVNAFLFCVSVIDGEMWFVYPLLGWGMAVAFHAATVFNPEPRHVERGARSVLKRRRNREPDRFVG